MRPMRSLIAAACVALAPQLASAQLTGSNTSSASTGTSFSSSSGGTTSGGSSGGTGSDLQSTFGGSTSQLTRGASLSDGTATATRVLSTSNAFGRFYASPYYTGIPGTATNAPPGGFGTALYGNDFLASTSTGGQGGINSGFTTGGGGGNAFTGNSGGVFSSQGGFGGNAGQFGGTGQNQFGSQNRTGTQQQLATGPNIVTQVPVRIAYTATLDFDAPPMTAPQMATDLRAVLDRSSVLSAKGIDLFTDGQVVIMRGTVASAREAKTAEGIIRLTPGVRGVKNELKIAGAPAPVPAPAP